jgi:molybdate transport system ATP-binding protein
MPPHLFITLENVSVRIGGQWAVRGLSWQICKGQNWVLWGPNGAGKTTLAKALLGDAPVVQGRIQRHYAQDPAMAGIPPRIAAVFPDQRQDLYNQQLWLDEMAHFSGRTDLLLQASQVLPLETDQAAQAEMASLLGLETILKKTVNALSAGEQCKLLIARALLKQPRLLILDEPFNGLDAAAQTQLHAILNRLGRASVQMVLITHRPEEIAPAFTHLLHLENRSACWQGLVADFFKSKPQGGADPAPVPLVSPQADISKPDRANPEPARIPLIQMNDVHVRYGPHLVLNGISWTVFAGENWALTGPNGAGKSTLLKLITGDNLQGYANDVILFGHPKGSGESVWQIKQQIGYVADDLQLRYQKKMHGFDVVCSGFFDSIGLYRHCSDAQRQTAQMWLETTGTQDLAAQLFSKLSHGQQRMLLVVRAMVKSPRLLILDEPCNGLDVNNRGRLLDMLDIIGCSPTTSLLYVSHRPEEMPACITHRLHLESGRIKPIT